MAYDTSRWCNTMTVLSTFSQNKQTTEKILIMHELKTKKNENNKVCEQHMHKVTESNEKNIETKV